jgi:hypothetical protein
VALEDWPGASLAPHFQYAALDMVAETERKLNTLSQTGEYTCFADFLTEVFN